MSEHTKGPWVAKQDKHEQGAHLLTYTIIDESEFCQIAKVQVSISSMSDWYAPAKDLEPNARLIAAAPDLLALCELVHGSFGGGRVVTFSDDDIAAFSAAIAKAKGQALTHFEPRASMAEQFEAEMSSAADREKAAEAKGQP